MVTVIDSQKELVDMIIANWNATNTSNVTPNIGKITDFPFEFQFGDGKGFVLIYSVSENENIAGIGLTTQADISESFKIDLRYGGMGTLSVSVIETRFLQYKTELKRILYSNRVNPTPNYCILDLDNKTITNLSNRTKKFYREVREVGLDDNNRDLTV